MLLYGIAANAHVYVRPGSNVVVYVVLEALTRRRSRLVGMMPQTSFRKAIIETHERCWEKLPGSIISFPSCFSLQRQRAAHVSGGHKSALSIPRYPFLLAEIFLTPSPYQFFALRTR